MEIDKYCNGFVTLKIEFLPSVSLDAQGVLLRMVNLPQCDYISAEDLHDMYPADTIDTIKEAINELVFKSYLFKSDDNRYAINKAKICIDMRFINPAEVKKCQQYFE